MYPTSAREDGPCGDFSIREVQKPAVPMIGFANQSHPCRVVHAETGPTPAMLRRLLSSP
jgi:hypothetical protein